MVKGLVFAAGVALVASTFPAQAMPVGPVGLGENSLVTTIAEGCGRGWERNRFGECRPMRGAAAAATADPPSSCGRPSSSRRGWSGRGWSPLAAA
jgi:hypothetical protein